MLRVSAKSFIELGHTIANTSFNLYMADAMARDDPSRGLQDDEREKMRQDLIKVWDVCNALGLGVSADLISGRVDQSAGAANVPENQREFNLLLDAVKSEIKSKLFLFVPSHLAKYYECDDLLSNEAREVFPSSTDELRSAGNCLSAGFNTACVFHSMRAVEHGMRALAAHVGVDFGVQQWQNVIDQIDRAVGNLGKSLPSGPDKTKRLQFLSEACSEFRHFKDGWRNQVMHTRASYDESG